MIKEKCIILIDGSNFFFKLKDLKLHNLLDFNFREFSQILSKDYELVDCTYYIGKIKTDKTEKTKKLFIDQRKLLARLQKHTYKYVLGYLMKSGKDDVYHEKGVDVNIAIDILTAAYENKCKKILLISSDTDLIPAVKRAIEKGVEIEYIGFKHLPSRAMMNNCSSYKLLERNDLKGFIAKEQEQKPNKAKIQA